MFVQERQDVGCPSYEIAAYIDGELTAERELQLDAHFAACPLCSAELNEQKQVLLSLNASLGYEAEMELPSNFTRLIVANAESSVTGLRRPRERFNAVFICAALFLFGLFALGTDAVGMFNGVVMIFERIVAVGGVFGHLVYSFVLGLVIILRSFAANVHFDAIAAVAVTIILGVSLMYVSRVLLRLRRA